MKKLFTLTLLALLCISTRGLAQSGDYQGIEISFNRSAATEKSFMNVTVVVKDLDGNAINGVTAEPVSWAASDLLNSSMGGAAAVSWTNKILIGGRYSNNNYNEAAEQNFVLKISGLRTGFAFNKAEVDLYGCNQSGASVNSSKISISCAIQTGNAADNLSAFVSSTGNNINGSQEGGLWHKVTTMKNSAEKTVGADEDLYVKVTIQKTNDNGTKCRPSFRTVKLLMAIPYTVTENSENLSDITDYTSYDSFIVPTGKTLNIDVDNFDLTKIQGAGTIAFNNATTTNSGIASDFTGTLNVNNASATVTISGNLGACTLQKTSGTLTYTGTNLNGTTLDGAILGGSERITTSNIVNIKNLAGNNLTGGTNNYAFTGSGTLNFYGNCDLTKKSDDTTNNYSKVGYPSSASIVINEGANVTTDNFYNSGTNNAPITNNGTITSRYFGGAATLGEGSTTTLSDETPFRGDATVSGDATLNLTAATATLSQAITVASGKTLTIDGNNNAIAVTGTVTNNGTIEFKNATLSLNLDDRNLNSLTNYTFTNCTTTLQFKETGDEYKGGGFTITNIPAGVTIKVKKYDATEYETVTPVDGTATISHEVGVSGLAAWLDYTFNDETLATNQPATPIGYVPNGGNAGSGQTLTIDNSQTSAVSYNSDGTFKVRYTPYRSMTWPENYTVAVSGNFPDVENGCLVAFGTKSANYLALIRGANSNEIKLVKGKGNNTYTNIQTMAAENATAAAHLVVFTKQGNVFKVYCDGVNVATTEYDQTLGGGLQVGSIHGGYANTGVVSVMDNSLTDDQKNAVFCNAIRVYNYIISDAQMEALKTEFPYVSNGGNYTRSISADAYLEAEGAWYNVGEETYTDLPTNNVEEQVTYYPDIVITTTAASTLTVNANMDSRNIEFNGAGKLTIASDGTHNISIKGSVTANGPVSIKYGETDLSSVPVSIGESGSVEFDFSAYNFSSVNTPTDYPVTGNTADYGSKVTGVYPSEIYHTYTLAHNGTSNSYILTVAPTVAFFQQQAIALVTPYYDGNYVGVGVGKYTISLGETSYSNMVDFENAVMAWALLEDCVEPTITLNMPTTGFYRFTSQNNSLEKENVGKYLHNYLTDGGLALNTTKDETTIFYVDCTNNTIMAYENGKFLNDYNVEPTVGSNFTWTIEAGTELGKYALKMGSTWYASDWNTTDKITFGEKDANALWAIEPVEELPLSVAADSYTSFSAPVAVTIPDNCYAYIATGEGTDVINMTKVTGNVAANTGMIISTNGIEIAGPLSFEIAESGTEYSNLLVANVAAANVSKTNNYFFGKVDDKYVFTLLSGDGEYTLPGHKAYLHLENNSGNNETARLSINWGGDDATGLSELSNENIKLNDGKYYQNGTVIVVRNGVKYNVAGQTIK